MKTTKFKSLVIFVLLSAFFVINTTAQPRSQYRNIEPGQRQICTNIPDLTEEQEEKINALHTEQLKESNEHRAEMAELRAKKRSLMIQDSPDMDELNSVIDEMTTLRGENFKKNAAHRQNIRELLTEEQRVYFDSNTRMRNYKQSPKMREGRPSRRGSGSLQGREMNRNR